MSEIKNKILIYYIAVGKASTLNYDNLQSLKKLGENLKRSLESKDEESAGLKE